MAPTPTASGSCSRAATALPNLDYVDRDEAFEAARSSSPASPACGRSCRPEDVPTSFELTVPDRLDAEALGPTWRTTPRS